VELIRVFIDSRALKRAASGEASALADDQGMGGRTMRRPG